MSDDIGLKELNILMKTIDFAKKIAAEAMSRGSTTRARSFLDNHNNKREQFKRKNCEIRHQSIHEQIEKSINALRDKKKSLSIIEKENIQTENIMGTSNNPQFQSQLVAYRIF